MISPKFYSQISSCPYCQGWGLSKYSSLKTKDICKECNGRGVFLSQAGNIYVWDAPFFVDYKSRERIKILKISVVLIAVLCLTLMLIFLRNLLLKI